MQTTETVEYQDRPLAAYIAEQLTMGTLKGFFPVSFIQHQDNWTGIYQIEGYIPLCRGVELSAGDALQAFCLILSLMEQMERNYVFPEDYLVNGQTVFLDQEKIQIKMIFKQNEEGIGAKEQLCLLLDEWKACVSEETVLYLDAMKVFLTSHQAGYRGTIHYCERLLHEVQVCEVS